jgi:hypothetical protein
MAGKCVCIAFRQPVHSHGHEHANGHEGKSAANRRGRKRGGADNETVDRGRDSPLVLPSSGVAARSPFLFAHSAEPTHCLRRQLARGRPDFNRSSQARCQKDADLVSRSRDAQRSPGAPRSAAPRRDDPKGLSATAARPTGATAVSRTSSDRFLMTHSARLDPTDSQGGSANMTITSTQQAQTQSTRRSARAGPASSTSHRQGITGPH